ncbi:essential MCU regulator, mitochondrial-like [Hydractinia symbiolongicarpus]|uniref:essential MCU regulator, mitochondrial-like n=1 Tax=Hydractinia symbiolongicarpus TaxID=13093 RepID=UPI00254DBA2F|nr:essential MCU regulator, mitochondrial-like [Hydractinia symbiolongicarpus]
MTSLLRRCMGTLPMRSSCVTLQSRQLTKGAIESKPYKFNWGIIPVMVVSVPCMYIGALAAKRGAEFLEEWNIFVPDDDDD